jgi:hypothetical protein
VAKKNGQDTLVAEQTTQPGEVPQTQMNTGWLSESSQPDHRRLLLDPTGNRYLEIPTEDIVLTRPLESAEASTGLGGSAVFVKQTAQMVLCRCRPMSVTDFVRLRRVAAKIAAAPVAAAPPRSRAITFGGTPISPYATALAPAAGPYGAPVAAGLQIADALGANVDLADAGESVYDEISSWF